MSEPIIVVDRSGYGIGMAKDSAWKEKISLEILQFHEDGFMETLDNKWMKLKTCDNTDSQPATLGLENMAGKDQYEGCDVLTKGSKSKLSKMK